MEETIRAKDRQNLSVPIITILTILFMVPYVFLEDSVMRFSYSGWLSVRYSWLNWENYPHYIKYISYPYLPLECTDFKWGDPPTRIRSVGDINKKKAVLPLKSHRDGKQQWSGMILLVEICVGSCKQSGVWWREATLPISHVLHLSLSDLLFTSPTMQVDGWRLEMKISSLAPKQVEMHSM